MKFMTTLNIAVGISAALFFASLAPPAQAQDNPYLPDPVASWESADHGHGSYCTVKPLGAIWSCEAPDASANGYGEGDKLGLPAREGKHVVHESPKSPDCEGGDKSKI